MPIAAMSKRWLSVRFPMMALSFVLCSAATPAYSQVHITEKPTPFTVAADKQLGPRFKGVVDFCESGALPWAMSSKPKLKSFLRLLYRHNWLASMFNDHDMRVASAFSNTNMQYFFGWNLDQYDESTTKVFMYNIWRCRKNGDRNNRLFAELRYIFNHHYPEIDTCLSSDESTRLSCMFASDTSGGIPTPAKADLRRLHNAVQRINQYYRSYDSQKHWIDVLRSTWLTASTRKSFKHKSAEFDLPVVPIDVVFRHVDQIVMHYESLQ